MAQSIHAARGCARRGQSVRTVLGLVVVLVAALVGGRAHAGPDASCPALPEDLVLGPGEPVRVGDKVLALSANLTSVPRFLPEGEHAEGRWLEIDLLARHLDPAGREARRGSYVTGLDVGYVLSGPAAAPRSGRLDFRLSSLGPAYGATLPMDEGVETVELEVEIAERDPDGAGQPDHHPEEACLELPQTLRFSVDLEAVLEEPGEGGGSSAATEDDQRLALLGSLDPRPGESYSDVWGYSDGAAYLAIIGSSNGTLFVDVTDPANPTEVADIPGPESSWRDMKTYLTYAYIVTEGTGEGQGMQIVDLSDPLDPVLVNTYAVNFEHAHNVYIDTEKGEAWLAGTDNGTRILDLSADPVNPTEIGSWTDRYVHDVYVDDNYAYLSEINNGRHEIADSTDPADLQILSSWPTPGGSSHNSWATDDHTLVATTDEVTGGHVAAYDVADKTDPVLLGEYEPDPSAVVHNVIFDDDDNERIGISHYALGAKYVDLHRAGVPVELGSYDTYPSGDGGFNGAWGVYVFDSRGYIYISDIQTGLYVLEYVPTGGTLSGVVRDATDSSPVPDARVVLLADGTEVTTDADGVYAVYAPEGEVQLRVSAWGFRTRVTSPGTMPLDGRLDADVDISRLPRVSLSGTVRRSDTSAGISGATVRIVGSKLAATTDAGGFYSFPEVAIGQQTLTAEAVGFSSEEAVVVLADGQALSQDLVLVPARFLDDAEADLAWTLGVPTDTATQGHWERVDPNGTGGGNVQPEDDHTPDPGVTAFITGQSAPGASTEANDVEGGPTTLVSPTLDATGLGAAQVRYFRWVSTGAGFLGGGTFRAQVSSDDGNSWVDLESHSSSSAAWQQREFDLGSFVPLNDQIRVRFRAEPVTQFPQYRVLECGVDDFELIRACRARFNAAAGDADGDALVDGCDACALDSANDADGDGICGNDDNAPFAPNVSQADADDDGVGDAADNCVFDGNPDQRDLDGDGLGDACDPDLDGDGVANASDADRDDDGVPDPDDRCPTTPDALQADRDDDGEGDACDPDDGEVRGVLVSGDLITWEPEQDSVGYNLYRGDLGAEALLALAACRVAGVPGEFYADPALPVPGDGFFYLVARTIGGAEGTLGFGSSGGERLVDSPCP